MKRRNFLRHLAILSGAPLLVSKIAPADRNGFPPTSPFSRYKVGVISDEWCQDFERALRTMQSYGLSWVEIRSVWGVYNTDTSLAQLQRIKELLQRYEFKVSVLDTALYKCALPGTKPVAGEKDAYPYAAQMDLLKRAIDRAHALGTDKLRVFAFWRVAEPEMHIHHISNELSKAAELAQREGIRLVLENEETCNVATGGELARMLKLVVAANLGANWDVGNGYWHGEVSYPDGYAALNKKRIWHMHLKDVRCGANAFREKSEKATSTQSCHTAIVGTGQVDLPGQLQALVRDDYQETMSLEPEYEAPSVSRFEATQQSLEALLKTMSNALE